MPDFEDLGRFDPEFGGTTTLKTASAFLNAESHHHHHHHHYFQEGLSLIPVPCILKMKLVPPSLPRSSYVSSSFWFIF
jgi:hypothetical protein